MELAERVKLPAHLCSHIVTKNKMSVKFLLLINFDL